MRGGGTVNILLATRVKLILHIYIIHRKEGRKKLKGGRQAKKKRKKEENKQSNQQRNNEVCLQDQ